ncbi:MAG TPA: metallopeptidase TldD-related protein [Acidimicrobiales bacterium]|nr:metallopeptidase TldD-related protein [Acidimicrobiales bacterium]
MSEAFPPAPELVEQLLAASRSDAAIAIVTEQVAVNVRFAVNGVTSNGLLRSRDVTVISFVGATGGTSCASLTRSGAVEVADMVAACERLARSAPPAADAADLVAGAPDDSFGEPPGTTGHLELSEVVAGLARAFHVAETRGVTLAGYVEHSVATTYLGSTTGLRRRFVQPTGQLQLNGRADAGRRSAWSSMAAAQPSDLDVAQHVDEVHRRLEWARRDVELPAGRYEVVLPPTAVADLMNTLTYYALSGRDARDGRTVFSGAAGTTRIGEQLSDLPFELRSDPAEAGLACCPFLVAHASTSWSSVFDNGADLAATRWIAGGRLANLYTPRADADERNAFAAPIDNLVLELPGATGTTEDLVARTGRGLLLTCLWYIRQVDPKTMLLTGLTRDGVYVVEDGAVTGAANNFRFNESPVDLLGRAVEAGATARALSRESGDEENRTSMPPLRIPDFNMSSVSPAS